MILREMEIVFFITDGEEHEGYVLGSNKEYFWLLVSDLKEVYQGHPNRVYDHSGKKCFSVYDRYQKVDELFDEGGASSSDLFSYSDEAEKIIRLLKTHKLILPP